MPIKLGHVGHFCIAVRDPRKSARFWTSKLNLKVEFSFPNGVVVGNENVDIALIKGVPRPATIDHVSFHLGSMRELKAALAQLRRGGVDLEDPGDEIGPEAPGSKNMGLWFHDPDGYRWELSVLAKPPRKPKRQRRTRKRG
jgi:catechol 2,3-dioxygenase-like lactoylglutathione lyase family enzyme